LTGALAGATTPLLAPHRHGVDRRHLDVKRLLDGLGDLQLVGRRVDVERVLAVLHRRVALLGDERLDDYFLGRPHRSTTPICSTAPLVRMSHSWPSTSRTLRLRLRIAVTPGRLRADFSALTLWFSSTTSTVPSTT